MLKGLYHSWIESLLLHPKMKRKSPLFRTSKLGFNHSRD